MADARQRMRDAAILVPLVRGADSALRLVLVRRTEGGPHAGQIAFPGGSRDRSDRTTRDTAVREACEEIGLAPEAIEILERLPVVEVRVSGFRVTPYLARITPPRHWSRDEREIAEVLEVRVGDLLHPDAHGESLERLPALREPQRIAYYRVGSYRLWGASYRILHPLLPRLAAGEWNV